MLRIGSPVGSPCSVCSTTERCSGRVRGVSDAAVLPSIFTPKLLRSHNPAACERVECRLRTCLCVRRCLCHWCSAPPASGLTQGSHHQTHPAVFFGLTPDSRPPEPGGVVSPPTFLFQVCSHRSRPPPHRPAVAAALDAPVPPAHGTSWPEPFRTEGRRPCSRQREVVLSHPPGSAPPNPRPWLSWQASTLELRASQGSGGCP